MYSAPEAINTFSLPAVTGESQYPTPHLAVRAPNTLSAPAPSTVPPSQLPVAGVPAAHVDPLPSTLQSPPRSAAPLSDSPSLPPSRRCHLRYAPEQIY